MRTTPRFDAINLLAKIHARLENWSAALPLWQECHRQQPHNPVIEMALQRANLEMQIDAAGMPSKVERVVRSGGGGGSDDADDPSAGLGNGDSPADDCPAQSASEAKARGLKDLAEDAFHRMDTRRALLLLGEAIGMAPHLADLWSLRSRVYEGIHRYKDALSDAQVSSAHFFPSISVRCACDLHAPFRFETRRFRKAPLLGAMRPKRTRFTWKYTNATLLLSSQELR